MGRTVFDQILARQIPCHRIHEDDQTLAFLDIGPLSPGHTLLIPKERAVTLDRLSDAAGAALGRVLPRLCRAVMHVSGAKDYNVLQNNGRLAHQEVLHVHFHIIPRFADSGLTVLWQKATLQPEAGAALAARIVAQLAADASGRGSAG